LDNIDLDGCAARNIAVIPATGGHARAVAGGGGGAPGCPGAFSYRARKPTTTRAIRPYLVAL
ncbi:hypothetical protein EGU54_29965, partial [Achromobacter aegrifaciens]